MKKYLIRSLKYFTKLCVICICVLSLMILAKMTLLTPEEMVFVLLNTPQGWILIAAAAVLSAFYPRFGFLARRIEGEMTEQRQQIVNALKSVDYELQGETEEQMTFRAKSPLRRLTYLYEDVITVSQYGQWIVFDGLGKNVVRAEYKMNSYLQQTKK